MATTIVMPQMGYDMQEGRVVKWLKKEGEEIARGEDVAEIETDKAVIPVPATEGGVLRKVLVDEGATVPVGEVIAVMGAADEELPADLAGPSTATPTAEAAPAPAETKPSPAPATAAASTTEVRATPLARRLASEKGVDLTKVTGTGPRGRITEKDVLAAAESQPSAAPAAAPAAEAPPQIVELSRMRQAIARLTTRSKQEAPHFYVTSEVNMSAAMTLRSDLNAALQDQDVRISVNDLIVKACALTLAQPRFASFNASFQGDKLEVHPHVNIGIAIDLEDRGLIIPGLLNCESKSLADIARGSRDLVERAKADKLRADEYTSTTFTVSNLGMFDVDSFIAIIYPPNSAVLALGRVKDRPIVQDGQVDGRQDDERHHLHRPPGRGRRRRRALPGRGEAAVGAPGTAVGVVGGGLLGSSFLRRQEPRSCYSTSP